MTINNDWQARYARLEEEGCIEHGKTLLNERYKTETDTLKNCQSLRDKHLYSNYQLLKVLVSASSITTAAINFYCKRKITLIDIIALPVIILISSVFSFITIEKLRGPSYLKIRVDIANAEDKLAWTRSQMETVCNPERLMELLDQHANNQRTPLDERQALQMYLTSSAGKNKVN